MCSRSQVGKRLVSSHSDRSAYFLQVEYNAADTFSHGPQEASSRTPVFEYSENHICGFGESYGASNKRRRPNLPLWPSDGSGHLTQETFEPSYITPQPQERSDCVSWYNLVYSSSTAISQDHALMSSNSGNLLSSRNSSSIPQQPRHVSPTRHGNPASNGTQQMEGFQRSLPQRSNKILSMSSEGEVPSGTSITNTSSLSTTDLVRNGDNFSHNSWDMVEEEQEYTTQGLFSDLRGTFRPIDQDWMLENGPWVSGLGLGHTNNAPCLSENIDLDISLDHQDHTDSKLVNFQSSGSNANATWNSSVVVSQNCSQAPTSQWPGYSVITHPQEEPGGTSYILQNGSNNHSSNTSTFDREFTPSSSTGENSYSLEIAEPQPWHPAERYENFAKTGTKRPNVLFDTLGGRFLEDETGRRENTRVPVAPQTPYSLPFNPKSNQNNEINFVTPSNETAHGIDEGAIFSLRGSLNNQSNSWIREVSKSPNISHIRVGSRSTSRNSNPSQNASFKSPGMLLLEDTPELREYLSKSKKTSKHIRIDGPEHSPLGDMHNWDNTFVKKESGFTDAKNLLQRKVAKRKLGRRTGPLEKAKREKASEMRKEKACLCCRISKATCSKGLTCARCEKQMVLLPNLICCRLHLKDYTRLFLPEQMVRPFLKSAIDKLEANEVPVLGCSHIEFAVSSGPDYPDIHLRVHTLRSDSGFFKCDSVFEPLPLRIARQVSIQELKNTLCKHIGDVIRHQRNYGEVVYDNTSQLAWDVHEAIWNYAKSAPENKFLQKLLSLYAMQYFMATSLVVSPNYSARNMNGPLTYDSRSPNLRMVNRQLKHVMLELLQDTYTEVLDELENQFRQKPNKYKLWAPSFSAILVLNMCTEMVQINTDFRIVNAVSDMQKSPTGLDRNGNKASREASENLCRELDDKALRSAESGFHLVYNKQSKLKDGSKSDRAFNPIRDGENVVKKEKLGESVEKFVKNVRNIVHKHSETPPSRSQFHGTDVCKVSGCLGRSFGFQDSQFRETSFEIHAITAMLSVQRSKGGLGYFKGFGEFGSRNHD
ncbi:hypothetical protein HYALB_00004409 [Hymenoscyphus albidus]|uniref:Zn(2)-C6 fungal-type domain-containing protein n=1 Tax=Hymenoscyphus albidus TaxID=595503 RepID=A0A9N9Q5N8_9HELO|nr:hypothetical protein HYALB_00004409 [Hymenoscyphus albidus]